MSEIFEKATRLKITFPFRGTISLYDLWDLKLEELDALYRSLNKQTQVSAAEGEGLIRTRKSKEDSILELKKEIVKHVFSVLSDEKDKKVAQVARKARQQEILSVITKKKGEALEGKSLEDLEKLYAEENEADATEI